MIEANKQTSGAASGHQAKPWRALTLAIGLGLGLCLNFGHGTAGHAATKATNQTQSKLSPAGQITNLIDDGKYAEAKTWLDELLARTPDAPLALYQLARLHLSTGAVSTETIVGFRYSSEAATRAEEALKKALSSTPDYPEAHALSGLLYAAQNRLPESAASFAAAEKAYVSPVWLDFNKAVLAVQMKEYEDAADLLKQLTAVHPNKKNKIAGKIYQSAWRLLRRLAVEHPELDPVRGIRNGHIKRVLAEDYADYLAQHKGSNKPLYVHFASSDNWCSPCAVNLKRVDSLARQHGDKFDFIHVSFEPWRSVSQYMSMLPKSIRALPYQVFISHGVEQAFRST